MKNGLVAAIVGAVVAGAIAFVVWGQRASQLQGTVTQLEEQVRASTTAAAAAKSSADAAALRPPPKKRTTTVELKDGGDGKCGATVEDPTVSGIHRRKVAWIIEHHPTLPCPSMPLGWNLQLRFEPDGTAGELPFGDGRLNLGQDGKIQRLDLKDETKYYKFPYTVWFRAPLTQSYPMVDPDLEVEPPPSLAAPAMPGNASPAVTVPPAKKQ